MWWAVAALAVPAALAAVAVLAVGDVRERQAAVVAAPPALPAAPGARPTPAAPVPAGPADPARLAAAVADRPIVFTADSAELTAPAATVVQEVAQLLAAAPDAPVLVEGHVADTPGGPEAGQRLSERRAEVVAEALRAAGVAGDRISTVGRGAERPLATVEQSRRVEISIG